MLPGLPQTLTVRIWQLAAIAMVAVVALSFTTYWHLYNTQQADHEVAETLHVLREMNRLGRYTADAQSAHLRYALTGRDDYLASYELWGNVAKAHLIVVRPLLTNTPGQQSNFEELTQVFWASFSLADDANGLVSGGRSAEAVELIAGDQSTELSTALQARWETVAEVERGRLETRRKDAAAARTQSLIILGIAGLLTLLLLALAAASITRSLRVRSSV